MTFTGQPWWCLGHFAALAQVNAAQSQLQRHPAVLMNSTSVVFLILNCWHTKLAVNQLCRIRAQTVVTHLLAQAGSGNTPSFLKEAIRGSQFYIFTTHNQTQQKIWPSVDDWQLPRPHWPSRRYQRPPPQLRKHRMSSVTLAKTTLQNNNPPPITGMSCTGGWWSWTRQKNGNNCHSVDNHDKSQAHTWMQTRWGTS